MTPENLGCSATKILNATGAMFFPIAIVFSEDVICDELEKMKQVLHDGGYDPSYLSPPPFESVLGLLASRVLQRAQELGIEVGDYKPSLCTTDKGELNGRVIFEFPDQISALLFKSLYCSSIV